MRKLTYITQLFAVMLLLVQLSGCDSLPAPEPISDKYARPSEVIASGIPVINADGTAIYQPVAGQFRYAAAMFANADGTMSAWYSVPGGANGAMPGRTSLNSGAGGGGPYPMHGDGQNGAARRAFDKPFYEWVFLCPSWSKPTGVSMRMKLFVWAGDYSSTVNGTPIATRDCIDYPDGETPNGVSTDDGYTEATGNMKFPAGNYLLYCQKLGTGGTNTPGVWGGGRGPDMDVWVNGSPLGGNDGFRTQVQYVHPAEVGYSAQIKYFTANEASNKATWSETGVAAVAPTKDKADKYYAKDPSVVKAGGFYYMAYTGSLTVNEEFDNNIFVARCAKLNGAWEKWNGAGWGGDPKPILDSLTKRDTYYGAGEPSMVVKDGQIYLYYKFSDQEGGTANIHLVTANATDANWPAALTDKGQVIDRSEFAGRKLDGCNVTYIADQARFQALQAVNYDGVNSYVTVWKSADGVTGWVNEGTLTSNLRIRARYARMVSDDQGHITANTAKLICYQYGLGKASFKTWMSSYSFAN